MRLTFGHATRTHSIPIMPLQLIGRTGIKPVCWGHQAWNWHLASLLQSRNNAIDLWSRYANAFYSDNASTTNR
ncbi:hypothetical protein [Moorena bouillonii]|uniref:hypothetical protein n=1 Tax=Moorena bouillonii TaxID=207920 RepID=UPI00117D02E0|nr:hypothetical protein [Moorena bouillonii]